MSMRRRNRRESENDEALQLYLESIEAQKTGSDIIDEIYDDNDDDDFEIIPLTEEEKYFRKMEYEEEMRGSIIFFFCVLI
jgi:hypothetical protein